MRYILRWRGNGKFWEIRHHDGYWIGQFRSVADAMNWLATKQ